MGAEESKQALSLKRNHKKGNVVENEGFSKTEIRNEEKQLTAKERAVNHDNNTSAVSSAKHPTERNRDYKQRSHHKSENDNNRHHTRKREDESSNELKHVRRRRYRSPTKEDKKRERGTHDTRKHRSPKQETNNDNTKVKRRNEKNNGRSKSNRHNTKTNNSRSEKTSSDQKMKTAVPENEKSSVVEKTNRAKNKHKRRKKTSDLSKNKHTHRSAPDLTNPDTSKVGAWLNSAAYYWQQDPHWQSSYSFPYATLPGMYSRQSNDKSGEPRHIVDGMGSPVGTLHPDGFFEPGGAEEGDRQPYTDYSGGMSQHYGMHPYFTLPYPYHYVMPPQYYMTMNGLNSDVRNERKTKDRKLKNRSRSHNHIDVIANDLVQDPDRSNQRENPKLTQAVSLDAVMAVTDSTGNSTRDQVVQYFDDIAETRNSISLSYKANQEISVDNVKHAKFTEPAQGQLAEEKDSDLDVSDSESLSDSSCNDVILDDSDVNVFNNTRKTEKKEESSILKVFQPVSKREVFIDESPEKHKVDKTSSIETTSTFHDMNQSEVSRTSLPEEQNTQDNHKAPIMRLCERESIVATSYLTDGGKVFCITRSKRTDSPVIKQRSNEVKSVLVSSGGEIKSKRSHVEDKQSTGNFLPESGTWFGLTGSPPAQIVNPVLEIYGGKEDVFPQLAHDHNITDSEPDLLEERSFSPEIDSNARASNPDLPSTFNHVEEPEEKDIFANDNIDHDDNVFVSKIAERSAGNLAWTNKISQPTYADVEVTSSSSEDGDSSSSIDSEPQMRDDGHSLASKLVRIDSHDSFTMKRRFRNHRRSSSQSEKPTYGTFYRRATIASISQNDVNGTFSPTTSYDLRHNVNVTSSSLYADVNPFKNRNSPDIDSFLYRAKSEELLKRELSKSTDTLMSGLSSTQPKESMQERAARILGLSSSDLAKAKQRTQNASVSSSINTKKQQTANELTSTTVTASKTAHGNISHSSIECGPVSPRVMTEEGSFAVSVTDSMLNQPQDQYEIKNVNENDVDSNSSDNISTISKDSSDSRNSSSSSSHVIEVEYTINVSDSVLEDASVPCKVKPHVEYALIKTATEYKLPDDIFTTSESSGAPNAGLISPSMAQASIVASYTDSLYDRMPTTPTGHLRENSDDTTESESLDQSSQGRDFVFPGSLTSEGVGQVRIKSEASLVSKNVGENRATPTNISYENRVLESPVPIASHSAPLTSGELDIIMQLYNSADESTSTCSYDVTERKASLARRNAELQKQKIAKAIGFDVRNIDQGVSRNNNHTTNQSLEKVEDFDIKIFPGSAKPHNTETTISNEEKGKAQYQYHNNEDGRENEGCSSSMSSGEGGVLEVMQSLGLDPDQAWLVSL